MGDTRVNQDLLIDRHVQRIEFNFPAVERTNINSKTFALSFKTKLNETFTTIPIVMGNPMALTTPSLLMMSSLLFLCFPTRLLTVCLLLPTPLFLVTPTPPLLKMLLPSNWPSL